MEFEEIADGLCEEIKQYLVDNKSKILTECFLNQTGHCSTDYKQFKDMLCSEGGEWDKGYSPAWYIIHLLMGAEEEGDIKITTSLSDYGENPDFDDDPIEETEFKKDYTDECTYYSLGFTDDTGNRFITVGIKTLHQG